MFLETESTPAGREALSLSLAHFKSDIMPCMEQKMNFQQQVFAFAQAAAATCAFFDPVQA